MKKLVSLLLCVCLACGLSISVSAASVPDYPETGAKYHYSYYNSVDNTFTYADSDFWDASVTQMSFINELLGKTFSRLGYIWDSVSSCDTRLLSLVSQVSNKNFGLWSIAERQDTLNNKVATAQNQVLLKNIVQSFADLFTDGYNSYTFYAGNDEWQNDVSWASGSFTDSFNSTSYSIIEGIRSIANVVASPEDKVFSDSMQSTETKQDLSSFKTAYGDNSNGDALGFGTTLISSMQFMDSGTAMGSIQAVLGGGDSEPWAWFSQATADDLDSAGGAAAVSTFALDSDSDSAAGAPPDDIVYFIDPDLNSADFLKQVQEAHK